MTLIKSLLLGSAAGLVAVSAAQAADLPTRKGPVAAEYVRVCSITVAGVPVVGFVLPGSDTCFRISGYVSAQMEAGNLKPGNAVAYTNINPAIGGNVSNQAITSTYGRDSFGYSTRFNLTLDAVSNTAYGPLVAHGEYQFDHSVGFDNLGVPGSDGGINRAYVTWAGLTAGKANSFFAFTGGGFGYANFFSPDRQGFNQPDLVAYTASFGGGFAATISIESAEGVGGPLFASGGSTQGPAGSTAEFVGSATQAGARIPDIVGALSYTGGWGRAQVSGLYHDVRGQSINGAGAGTRLSKGGYAIDAGVEFNIPSYKGAKIGVTGAYSQNDIVASGIPDGVWGDGGQAINGNGQGMALGDAFANPNGTWATPKAFTITAYATAPVSSTVTFSLEGSYGELKWTGQQFASLLSNSKSFLVGGVINYDPVKNLDFQLELFYQNTKTDQPTGYGASAAPGFTSAWQGRSDGFAGRLFVTRSF